MSKLLSTQGMAWRDIQWLQSGCRSWGQEVGLDLPHAFFHHPSGRETPFHSTTSDILATAGHPLGTSDSGASSPSLQE